MLHTKIIFPVAILLSFSNISIFIKTGFWNVNLEKYGLEKILSVFHLDQTNKLENMSIEPVLTRDYVLKMAKASSWPAT